MSDNCHLKLDYLNQYAGGLTFIETGTYMGAGVKRALEYGFRNIHSIEIDDNFYELNVNQFKENSEVRLWHGDSVELLPEIMKEIGEDEAVFWLDAHASGPLKGGIHGPSPLLNELRITSGELSLSFDKGEMKPTFIKRKVNTHTIFIDDRRLLGSAEWGFVKEQDVMMLLNFINPEYKFFFLDGHVQEDIICATTRIS